jgi:shikimate kinase
VLPNIVLVGFMGSGKSSVGRRLALATGHRFVDTDEIIVERCGKPIAAIFAEEGEARFREIETETLRSLVGVCGIILATGGGIVLRPENRGVLREIGVITWLDASPDTLFERVSRTRKRPLLHSPDPRGTFDRLLAERRPIYEAFTELRIDSTGLTHEESARAVLESAMRAHRRGFGC